MCVSYNIQQILIQYINLKSKIHSRNSVNSEACLYAREVRPGNKMTEGTPEFLRSKTVHFLFYIFFFCWELEVYRGIDTLLDNTICYSEDWWM